MQETLQDGELSATEIYNLAEEEGIKQKTLRNAKNKMGISVVKKNNKWYWKIV